VSELVRVLTDEGTAQFTQFLGRLREGSTEPVPYSLLTAEGTSAALSQDISVERKSFSNRFAFGEYLVNVLKPIDGREVTNANGLWNWLALYFFDSICPVDGGKRNVLEDAVYVLGKTFNYRNYYRHLVRTPWLAVSYHGEYAKVMLLMRDKGSRSELFEQLAGRQEILGNPTAIRAAYRLYFDPAAQRPKVGAGSKGGGTPRRLGALVQQLDLTHDLRDCTVERFLALLPPEFGCFRNDEAETPAATITAASSKQAVAPAEPTAPA
jgi:hypothetical protein